MLPPTLLRETLMLRATAVVMAACALGGCGGGSTSSPGGGGHAPRSQAQPQQSQAEVLAAQTAAHEAAARRAAAARAAARPVVTPPASPGPGWRAVVTVAGQVAAWEAERSGATLLRFDQRLVRLRLHAGSAEPGGSWRYGDRIRPSEIHRVVAAFNGGFKFDTGQSGFLADGRAAAPLQDGLASIVTYQDGVSEIGAWRAGVPAHGRPVASVLQDLHLLVDHGAAAASTTECIQSCWGATLGGGTSIARSALGVTGDGQLVWAAGEMLSPAGIAQALVGAGVQRAIELDINPQWVAGYLYLHRAAAPAAVPVVPGQNSISGQFLEPYARDFLTVVAR
jgi:hypothetical protein